MDTRQLSDIERELYKYFKSNFQPLMDKERKALQAAQAKETSDFNDSFAGFMQFLAMASNPNMAGMEVNMELTRAKSGGKALNKKDEDYMEDCMRKISGNDRYQEDLARFAVMWRDAVVKQVGRERYDQASQAIGSDLALAYIDYRVTQLMIDRMVEERMPKSSFEYVIRKGASQSLLGLAQWAERSPLSEEIESRGEAAYKPSDGEKRAAEAVAFANDIVTFGGCTSWGSLLRTAGFEIGFQLAFGPDEDEPQQQQMTVEDCISQGVFGCEENIFPDIIRESRKPANSSVGKGAANAARTAASHSKGQGSAHQSNASMQSNAYAKASAAKATETRPDFVGPPRAGNQVPQSTKLQFQTAFMAQDNQSPQQDNQNGAQTPSQNQGQTPAQQSGNDQQTNESGWGNLLASIGLDGIGDLGKNLGYVMAMMPDLLFGFFTGDNKRFNIGDNLMPLASVLLGLFVKNPILKMVFIGMGGANLLNKAAHDALDKDTGKAPSVKYKQYADEPLDPRITNPTFSGNTLIANIDRVPYSISLPQTVVDAYRSGALPLNTLANATLRQHDKQQAMAQNIYDQQQNTQNNRNIQLR